MNARCTGLRPLRNVAPAGARTAPFGLRHRDPRDAPGRARRDRAAGRDRFGGRSEDHDPGRPEAEEKRESPRDRRREGGLRDAARGPDAQGLGLAVAQHDRHSRRNRSRRRPGREPYRRKCGLGAQASRIPRRAPSIGGVVLSGAGFLIDNGNGAAYKLDPPLVVLRLEPVPATTSAASTEGSAR